MSVEHRVGALLGALLVFGAGSDGAETARRPMPWDTCVQVEGKGSNCGSGNKPKAFADFLDFGSWAREPQDGFSAEFEWDIKQKGEAPLKTAWRDIGILGSSPIRSVRYLIGEQSVAEVVLAERSPCVFAPLMKWSGEMPEAVVYEHGGTKVLVINKDWGGNVPMVETWAWIWGPNGPIRLDVDAAIAEAIEKVAPQYAGSNTGLKWDTLQCHTYVWKGDYPGKIGVGAEVNAWFALSAKGLVLKRAEFHEMFEDNPKTIR